MKVLTATAKGQGKRKSDFFWMEEGELVRFPFECDGESVDGKCGCRRSMTGLDSKRGGTTFTVTESPMTEQEFISKLQTGFHTDWNLSWSEAKIWAKKEADELLRLAEFFNVGDILERRGRKIQARVPNVPISEVL